MIKRIDAIHEHGVLRLLEPINLAENQRVTVELETEPRQQEFQSAYDQLRPIMGTISDEDLLSMEAAIAEGCEQIDPESWK